MGKTARILQELRSMADPYDLERFVAAQNAGATYHHAIEELRRGRKTSHWMWFVFPQITGLGRSHLAMTYAITSLEEARTYLQHPVLGPRLRECAVIVAGSAAGTAREIFGDIDTQKLRSSITLFLRADPAEPVFQRVLDRYFGGHPDSATDQLIGSPPP